MNDDFLHRLRKTPPPEFLTELKTRLDRQPKLPSLRRSGFRRGVIVGLLIAGVSFAVTSVSLTGWPASPRQFFSAPVELLNQALTRHKDSEQEANRTRIKAVPLGPAWFPAHVNAQPAAATDVGQTAEPPPSSNTASSHMTPAASTKSATTTSGAAAKMVTAGIGAQRAVYSFARSNLIAASRGSYGVVELPGNAIFAGLCGSPGSSDRLAHSGIVETTHRITSDPGCRLEHAADIVEVKLGYLAVVLARSKLYIPMNLSAHDLFLALAKRVPDPAHPNQLVDNFYTTWNEIDPALPYDYIQFYGPAPNSPEGRLAAELLLDAGCTSLATQASHQHDAPTIEPACREVRTDSRYTDIASLSDSTETLNITPTALGIFSFKGFEAVQNRLNANPIDGSLPDYAEIAARRYPGSAAIYLYVPLYNIPTRYQTSTTLLITDLISAASSDNGYYGSWGFVRLDEAEAAVTRAYFEARKTVQF